MIRLTAIAFACAAGFLTGMGMGTWIEGHPHSLIARAHPLFLGVGLVIAVLVMGPTVGPCWWPRNRTYAGAVVVLCATGMWQVLMGWDIALTGLAILLVVAMIARFQNSLIARALVEQAEAACRRSEWEQARDLAYSALKRDATSWHAQYLHTLAVGEGGLWKTAGAAATALIKEMPLSSVWRPNMLRVLGKALVVLGRDEEAIRCLQDALTTASEDPQFPADQVRQQVEMLQQGRGNDIRDGIYVNPYDVPPRRT
ncbi:MAG: hypothetical protein Q7T82_06890 [Armatimonadota bacterium]|nr:hypothetical protein [Armatimonadota bacterium]